MTRVWKVIFLLMAKAVVWLLLGLRIQHRQRLPRSGPAILVANHNSHLDTFVILSLFPLSMAHRLRPVANEEYFLKQSCWLAWFSRHVLDIIPVSCEPEESRSHRASCGYRTFLRSCAAALAQNQILILYPEGSRGKPEHLGEFRSGIAHLAKQHPEVPIVPIFLQGLGKALPKGERLLVPFLCWTYIGEPLYWSGQKKAFLEQLTAHIQALSTEKKLLT
ncbi:lysophospholipid acyltransferase family protein [Pseudanabaena sp. FACHB-2040]|uniref:lysophospholipid acyltransferase family protein n=1 Tax=Pseudanabaena sp. FACHB-2040 TaxID=2692859 RepID=UPI0016862664|nr:lysophospholipid acyltransferase family protein [Pseudanabaena sp. FACHB-2040]MBD2258005.1 1-acyl-sn-glycerol-3-phosphate acyltransferase [Pseudanabaena sp. FACHB-2040]